jgi:hypothetical protein
VRTRCGPSVGRKVSRSGDVIRPPANAFENLSSGLPNSQRQRNRRPSRTNGLTLRFPPEVGSAPQSLTHMLGIQGHAAQPGLRVLGTSRPITLPTVALIHCDAAACANGSFALRVLRCLPRIRDHALRCCTRRPQRCSLTVGSLMGSARQHVGKPCASFSRQRESSRQSAGIGLEDRDNSARSIPGLEDS